MRQAGTLSVVVERGTRPAGRNPLSTSASHSYPSTPAGSVATCPGASDEMLVFLQKRILPSAWGTVMESLRTSFTRKLVPLKAFSGQPPAAGGLNRESRHMPAQMGGPAGAMALLAIV